MKKAFFIAVTFSLSTLYGISMPEWVQPTKDYVNKNWQCLRYGTGPDCTKEKQAQLTKLRNGLIAMGVIGGTAITGRVLYQKMRMLTVEEAKKELENIFGVKPQSESLPFSHRITVMPSKDFQWNDTNIDALYRLTSKLPHTYQNQKIIYEIDPESTAKWITLEFKENMPYINTQDAVILNKFTQNQ